jgi:hypothetical protein
MAPDIGEGELKEPEGEHRDAGRPVRVRRALQEEVLAPDEAVTGAKHEGEAEGPEERAAKAGIDDSLEEDVDRLASAGKACFEEQKPCLHEEHQEGGDQRPHGVERVDTLRMPTGVVGRPRGVPQGVTEDPDPGKQQSHPEQLASGDRGEEATTVTISPSIAQASDLIFEA